MQRAFALLAHLSTLHKPIQASHAFFTPQRKLLPLLPRALSRHTIRRGRAALTQIKPAVSSLRIIIHISNLAHYYYRCCASASRSCCTTALHCQGPSFSSLSPPRRSPTSHPGSPPAAVAPSGSPGNSSAQGPVKRASEPGKELLACLVALPCDR